MTIIRRFGYMTNDVQAETIDAVAPATLDLYEWLCEHSGPDDWQMDFTMSGGPVVIGPRSAFVDAGAFPTLRAYMVPGWVSFLTELLDELQNAGAFVMPWNDEDVDRLGAAFVAAQCGSLRTDDAALIARGVRGVLAEIAQMKRSWTVREKEDARGRV